MNNGSSPHRRPSGSDSRSPSRSGAVGSTTPRRGSATTPLQRTASQRSLAARQAGQQAAGHTASMPRQPQHAHITQNMPNGIIPDTPRVTQQPAPVQQPQYRRQKITTKDIDRGARRGLGWICAAATIPIPFIYGTVCCCQCTDFAKSYFKAVDECCTDCGGIC